MKKRIYGLSGAIFLPIMVFIIGFMQNKDPKNLSKALSFSIPATIISVIWLGLNHNLIIFQPEKLIVRSPFFPWVKPHEIELNEIRRVFIDGGTRYSATSFTCFLEDEKTIRFRSQVKSASTIKKIIIEFENLNIDVETYRI